MKRSPQRTETSLRKHHLALVMRLAPALVLVIGFLVLTSMMPTGIVSSAGAQTPFQQFPANQYSQPLNIAQNNDSRFANPSNANSQFANNPNGLIPTSIPESETAAAETSTNAESSWSWPAPIAKIAQGGWLMLPLCLCSLIVLSLSMERLIALRRGRVIPRPFVRRFTECVEDGQLSYEEANEICEEFDAPVAEVFRAAVRRWGRPMLEIEQAVLDAGDRVGDELRRFLRVFHAISNVAPLIGLLGTVLGMIDAFEMLGTAGSVGQPELLAPAISVALFTTAGGLFVAIPAYLAYMYFSSKSDRYLAEIDKLCTKVIDSISAEALEAGGATARRKKRAAS
jgi:biopolymer transport protein ExbB